MLKLSWLPAHTATVIQGAGKSAHANDFPRIVPRLSKDLPRLAGEAPIPGVDRDTLVAGLRARGHRRVATLDDATQLAPMVHDIARPGDYVVLLGAGNITQWAYALPGELKELG